MIPLSSIKTLATDFGLDLVGVVSAKEAGKALAIQADNLSKWQTEGFAGEMDYMNRPVELFLKLENFLPGVKSVISFVVPYALNESVKGCPTGYGKVARYAWGRDYHRVLKKRLNKFTNELINIFPEVKARNFTDAVPLLERTLVEVASLGFVGKNTMLIVPKRGSFTFLAEILIDTDIVNDVLEPSQIKSSCGSCARCLEACPTEAFTSPFKLDARKCISYLTIEKKTEFNDWEAEAVGEWLFGCDICQEVCPYNHRNQETEIVEFLPERGGGSHLDLLEILNISNKEDFTERFSGTALMRTGRVGLLRNASAVVANTNFLEATTKLIKLSREDTSDVIRSSARQALLRLESKTTGVEGLRIKRALG